MADPKGVVVAGAAGRMGREVVKAILGSTSARLLGAIDQQEVGKDAGELAGLARSGVLVREDLRALLAEIRADALVDFTRAEVARQNARLALEAGVTPLIGTTGLSEKDLDDLHELCERSGGAALVAPNFALGAVLLMEMCRLAARYFPNVEIIELHHDQKLDAPSGTALKTAEMIAGARSETPQLLEGSWEKVAGARGARYQEIQVHSVRLPGLVAHQEVIFGGLGQTLTLRHDSLNRESFMPGVLLAVERVGTWKGVVYGLEHLLDLN